MALLDTMTTINAEETDSELTSQLTGLTQADSDLDDMQTEMVELVNSSAIPGEYFSDCETDRQTDRHTADGSNTGGL